MAHFPILRISTALAALGLAAGVTSALPIRLVDGTVIEGEIIRRDDSTVTVRSASLGELRLKSDQLAKRKGEWADTTGRDKAEEGRDAESQAEGSPADQSLFFLPTAFTPKQGTFSFRDFELLFLTLGYSATNSTSITGGFLFPFNSDVQLLTLGLKQQVWHGWDGCGALAVTANYTQPMGDVADTYTDVFNTNLVASYRGPFSGDPKLDGSGIHVALGYLGGAAVSETINGRKITHWADTYSFGAGVEGRMTPHAKAIVEYLSGAPFDPRNDFNGGLFTFGIRLHGNRLAADIAAVRPITDVDLGSLVFWPLLLVTYRI